MAEFNGRNRATTVPNVRTLTSVAAIGLLIAVVLGMSAYAAALPPYAQSPMIVDELAGWMPLLLVLGFVGLLVLAAGWKSLSMNKRMVAAGVVGLLFAFALVPILVAPVGPSDDDGTGYNPEWEIIMQTTRSTARDIQAEIFDSQGGTGGGGETPTATLCAYGTNAEVDLTNKFLRHAITVDDDLATSAASFAAPDTCSFDFSFRLLNPQDANGDGVMDSVSIFGRVRSISATRTEDGNGTASSRNLYMRDSTFGWYMGWSRDVDTINTDGQWISIAPAGVDDAQLGTSYDWVNLGSNAGADEDYATFAYIGRNYGWFGFTLPPIGFTYTTVVDVGTPNNYTTVTVIVFLSARA